jgi:diketogulonate reductase-like aldo/keto reductase
MRSKLSAMSTDTVDQSFAAYPRIIYGTAWKKADTARLVTLALGQGFRAIDTACQPKHYNEAGVGEGLALALSTGLRRSDLFVQTKFTPLSSQDPLQLPYDPNASVAEQVAQSFQASLRQLQTTYLDSLILHSPLADDGQTLEAWRAMEALAERGGSRRLGLSNCYSLEQFQRLYESAEVKPATLQNRFHDKTGYDRELRAYCLAHGVVYQSFWTLTANPQVLAHDTVKGLAARYQRSPSQVFFRYLTQIEVVPLTGTTSAQHMLDDLAIFEFVLQADELDRVGRLLG